MGDGDGVGVEPFGASVGLGVGVGEGEGEGVGGLLCGSSEDESPSSELPMPGVGSNGSQPKPVK